MSEAPKTNNQARSSTPSPAWHTLSAQEVSDHFDVDSHTGMSAEEARRRLDRYGPNRLREQEEESLWDVFWEEIREPMILLLLVTGVLYTIWGGWADGLTIFVVILILVGTEVYNEYRAGHTIAALFALTKPTAHVLRGGETEEIPSDQVVPGDTIVLQVGQRVPADARLLEAYGLAVDESPLTGESVPVDKQADADLDEETPVAERRTMVFSGTTVTRGRGRAVAVATGAGTELGQIADLTAEAEAPRTLLQNTMRELTQWMVWLALGFSVLGPLLGWLLAEESLRQMVLTGLSLAFATIPEELPIIITIVLALGGYRLSKRQAIAKDLQAVETLGAVNVIATDKTGTLTQNRMEVERLSPEDLSRRMLEIGVLCNDAVEGEAGFAGDPLDTALLRAAKDAGLDADEMRQEHSLRDEFTFDNTRKRMSAVYRQDGGLWVAVKGAPEAILAQATRRRTGDGEQPLSDDDRRSLSDTAAHMARDGLRVIAFAEKSAPDDGLSQEQAESELTFVGLAGLADQPRPEVKDAIAASRQAGVRTIMITGDHPLTARAIARQVGLDGDEELLTGQELDALSDEELNETVGRVSLYARTTPQHKIRIVRALQDQGQRVAVTGDGINDAPALSAADIGIAMGETGTDVAREAADIVLADDNFATIVRAVREGRVLFANLTKGVRYYLAVKVALISTTLLPVILSVPIPFAPIQIIIMELFMDLAASATFVAEPPEADLMRRPPRDPDVPFMNRATIGTIFSSAAGLFAAVTVAYLVTWYTGTGQAQARTVAFVTWLLGHVFLALNMRSEREPLVRLGLFSNWVMVIWASATIVAILLVTLVPAVEARLKTTALSPGEWALVVGAALVGTFWIEVRKWFLGGQIRGGQASYGKA
jgi:Ca2+-transporting ATPase